MSTIINTLTNSVFDISLESIAKAISHLSIEGLGEINKNTNLFSYWPSPEQWQSYQQKLVFKTQSELPSAEKEVIETNLAAIDSDLNSYLKKLVEVSAQENQKVEISQLTNALYNLLERCESLQKQIDESIAPRHYTYPYFAHTLILHLTVLKACILHENDINESQLMKTLLEKAVFDISRAETDAYQQRIVEIKKQVGGAKSELIYVQDSRFQESLTQWCESSEKLKEIDALYQYLTAKIPLDYVQNIPFVQGYEIVELIIGNSSDTKIGQDLIKEEQRTRNLYQQRWSEAVETTWQLAQSSADLLLKYAPQNAMQRSGGLTVDERLDIALEAITTIYTSIIGSLPIPGAGIFADGIGLLLGWLTGDNGRDPWKELEDSLTRYVDETVLDLELSLLRRDILHIEEEFDELCKKIQELGWKPGESLNSAIANDLRDIFREARKLKRTIYNPRTGKHTSLPYFERCFTLYLAVMSTAVNCLDTFDPQDEYESFYNDTRNYLNSAVADGFHFRKGLVNKWVGMNFFGQIRSRYTKDERTGIELTERWNPYWGYIQDRTLWYLQERIASLYLSQLGLHRMFKSFNSAVEAYNRSTGLNIATTNELNIWINRSMELANQCRQEAEKYRQDEGWPSAGVGYRFFDPLDAQMFNGPTFYEHGDYKHDSSSFPNGVNLAVGRYKNLDEIQGLSKNSLSSVKVPKGWKITLFDQVDFKGNRKELTKDSALLSDFNDKTCSLIVEIDLSHEFPGLRI
jgi:hypothetical protein